MSSETDKTTPETAPANPLAALPWNVLGPAIAVALVLSILIGSGLNRPALPPVPTPALPTVAAPAARLSSPKSAAPPVAAPPAEAAPTAASAPAEMAPTADPALNFLEPINPPPPPAQAAPVAPAQVNAPAAPAELERLPSDLAPIPTATPVCVGIRACRGGRP